MLAEARWKQWHKRATDRLEWLERRRATGEAAVYAALVPGNRLTAARRWNEAATAYEEVRKQYLDDPQVHFRLGYLSFRRGDPERALVEFRGVVQQSGVPDWLKAYSMLFLGRVHDLAGRRSEAVNIYKRVVDDYEHENAAWAAKVGLVTPYRRPLSDSSDQNQPGLIVCAHRRVFDHGTGEDCG